MIADNPAEPSPLIEELFPAGVVAAELRASPAAGLLMPAEADCLGRSVPKRVQEFTAGRLCARLVLQRLGITGFALVAAPDRRPVWPAGIVGSITHTAAWCAAVAGEGRLFAGLGVDTEVVGNVTTDLWPTICVPGELDWIAGLARSLRPGAAALVFAAKEAFYKAQYPLTGEWLDFADLRIEITGELASPQAGQGAQFRVHPTRAIAIGSLAGLPVTGRYRFHERYASAGVAFGAGAQ